MHVPGLRPGPLSQLFSKGPKNLRCDKLLRHGQVRLAADTMSTRPGREGHPPRSFTRVSWWGQGAAILGINDEKLTVT